MNKSHSDMDLTVVGDNFSTNGGYELKPAFRNQAVLANLSRVCCKIGDDKNEEEICNDFSVKSFVTVEHGHQTPTLADYDDLAKGGNDEVSGFRNEDATDRFVASETVIQQIMGGGSVEVGGCFIDFAEGTFDEPRVVKVTAEIDPNKWPPGQSVITPSLHVDAGEMKKAAKVRLPTWCLGIDQHEDPYFEILRLSEVSGKWSAVGEAQKFRSTEFIEFECMRFSWLVVAFRKLCLYICDCKPIVYISGANICSALVISTKLHKGSLLRSLKKDWNNANVQKIQFGKFSKKDHDQIDCELNCGGSQRDESGIVRETEISIRPTNICRHKVEDLLRNGGASTKCLSLVVPRHQGAISVVLTCRIKADGKEFDSGSRNVMIPWPGAQNHVSPGITTIHTSGTSYIGGAGHETNYINPRIHTLNDGGRINTTRNNCAEAMH